MSTIQFGGVVSGLNTQGIIDALVAVKKQPLTDLQSREATLTSQKAAYSQLGSAIDSLEIVSEGPNSIEGTVEENEAKKNNRQERSPD